MKSLLKIVSLCFLGLGCFAQSVTILPGGITPAMAGNIPSLSYDAIMALPSPGIGSLATDLTYKCLRFYDGKKWAKLLTNQDTDYAGVNAWSAGGSLGDMGQGIALDANGNIYLTGHFSGTASFGNISHTSEGGTDIFFAKYNKAGVAQWVRKAGGLLSDTGNSVAVDNSGNVFVTGSFQGTATFDNTSLISTGKEDIFIAKYSSIGTLEWVRKAGGVNEDIGVDLVTDASGNVYVTGNYEGGSIFGSKIVSGFGDSDVFIVKYSAEGDYTWVKTFGGQSTDNSKGIGIDASGAIYLTGNFKNTITIGNTSLTSKGGVDIFFSKYNNVNDTWVWAKQIGGTNNDYINDIAIDAQGSLWLGGGFQDIASFGSISLESEGNYDIFLAQYNVNGNLLWVKRYGGERDEYIISLALDAQGNIYASGFFGGVINLGKTLLESFANNDMFFAKFKPNGMVEWAQSAGGVGEDYPTDVVVDPNGNMYVTGYFYDSIHFNNTSVVGAGAYDILLLKLRD
ncbi:SBBP repeat-containing protein [Emticicia sp. C21]|uniref:SBBP repeat-containing protein n=1 Tax=Emticicia sp. C21 TaxID=2302915 RepID=UPI0013146668|nr:SBBP repeat-containing protein [Emticicia sp. C21]